MALFRRDDPKVIAIGAFAFRAQCVVMPFQSFVVISNILFQSIGKAKPATWMSVLRQGLCFLPVILTFPQLFGVLGVQISQPVADCFTFVIALLITLPFLRRLNEAIRSCPEPAEETGNIEKSEQQS
jgi:Na+-driven multidrug efflux pump